MPSFNLAKGGKFAIEKSLTAALIGLGWDPVAGKSIDVDGHAFGLVYRADGSPVFFNDASHALTYANKPPSGSLKANADKSFQTVDGALHHSGDCRTGSTSSGGADETITVDLAKLPEAIVEIQIWLTIHEPNGGTFGMLNNAFVAVSNKDSGVELCRFNLGQEFASFNSVQCGSLYKKDGSWSFVAVGAGVNVGLGDILSKLS